MAVFLEFGSRTGSRLWWSFWSLGVGTVKCDPVCPNEQSQVPILPDNLNKFKCQSCLTNSNAKRLPKHVWSNVMTHVQLLPVRMNNLKCQSCLTTSTNSSAQRPILFPACPDEQSQVPILPDKLKRESERQVSINVGLLENTFTKTYMEQCDDTCLLNSHLSLTGRIVHPREKQFVLHRRRTTRQSVINTVAFPTITATSASKRPQQLVAVMVGT